MVEHAIAPRLPHAERRAALIDAARGIISAGGPADVSVEAVALAAGVSRPLVYKHFANRDELVAAVFRQEAIELDAAIAASVTSAPGLEGKVRALVRGVIDAEVTRGAIYVVLAPAARDDPAYLEEQWQRDRRTVRFFARVATDELGIDPDRAKAGMAILLTGLASLQAQWRSRPTDAQLRCLEDLYVDLVMGGLAQTLTTGTRGARGSTRRAPRGG